MWRRLLEGLDLDDGYRWVIGTCASAVVALTLFYAHVFAQLSAVRPLLVFILVDGEPPPVCGLCVLFGAG